MSASSSGKMMQYDYLVKLLIIGDSGVGKSSLLARFTDEKFAPCIGQTIGMDFKVKMLELGRRRVKLQVWDSAGQERFHTITQQYYRNAMGIILAYDVSCEESFANVRKWAKEIATHCSEGIVQLLVGTKADTQNRTVDIARGQALAEELGIPFLETSAKSGHHVDQAFTSIADAVCRRLQGKDEPVQPGLQAHCSNASPILLLGKADAVALQQRGCCADG